MCPIRARISPPSLLTYSAGHVGDCRQQRYNAALHLRCFLFVTRVEFVHAGFFSRNVMCEFRFPLTREALPLMWRLRHAKRLCIFTNGPCGPRRMVSGYAGNTFRMRSLLHYVLQG